MSAPQNEAHVIERINHADSLMMSTSLTSKSTNNLLEKVLENRERRRQSIKSLRDEVRSRRSSIGSEASLEEFSTATYERKHSQASSSSSCIRRRSTLSSSRERVSITMESLRRMALDLDLDDSEEEAQAFQNDQPSVPTIATTDPFEYAKSSELSSSTTRDLMMNKDQIVERQHKQHLRASTSLNRRSTGDIIMANLRQLAASLEDDNTNWDSSTTEELENDCFDNVSETNNSCNIRNNNKRKSLLKFRSSSVRSAFSIAREGNGNGTTEHTQNNGTKDDKLLSDNFDEGNDCTNMAVHEPVVVTIGRAAVGECVTMNTAPGDSCSMKQNAHEPLYQEQQLALLHNFATEHKIFLKAALDLLAERERFAVEASLQLSDPNRIIKAGTLRKSKQFVKGIWKVKYVEIKPGVLTYYDDYHSSTSNSNANSTISATATSSSSMISLSLLEDLPTTTTKGSARNYPPTTVEAVLQQTQHNYNNRPKRKVIPLIATECRCRALKLSTMSKVKSTYGFIFEVSIPSQRIKTLWMASSTEERQSWMRAIREAVVGGSRTRATNDKTTEDYYFPRDSNNTSYNTTEMTSSIKQALRMPLIHIRSSISFSNASNTGAASAFSTQSPYQTCIEKYVAAQQQLRCATDKISYMGGMAILWRDPLRIPVHWIRLSMMAVGGNCSTNQAGLSSSSFTATARGAFQEDKLEMSVQQLWKDLVRDSVSINGELLKGDIEYGPERIMGALASKIRAFDKLFAKDIPPSSSLGSLRGGKLTNIRISEAQAILYARDILLACNRTRSAGDSYYCMEMLCSNPDLVVICPISSEALPLKIVIKRTANDASRRPEGTSKRGWVHVRSRKMSQREELYCELTDGVLNIYEKEHPTPQKLRGQMVLVDAKMGSGEISNAAALLSERFRKKVLRLVNESPSFSVDLALPENFADSVVAPAAIKSGKCYFICLLNKSLGKELYMSFDEEDHFLSWKQSVQKSVESCNNDSSSMERGSLDVTLDSAEFSNSTEDDNSREVSLSKKIAPDADTQVKKDDDHLETKKLKSQWHGSSTVQVTVEASTIYKICTTDPQGDDYEDTWATIQTKFVQSFQLTGGSSGKITRGEEIVQMLLLRGSVSDISSFDHVLKQRNKAKLFQLEDLSMRNIVL